MKQKGRELQRETEKCTPLVGDFHLPLSIIDVRYTKKMIITTNDLNITINLT